MAKKQPRQKDREERIEMEIIVDAYGPEEQAMGWYYYLEEKLRFPFTAVCSAKRATSPLQIKEENPPIKYLALLTIMTYIKHQILVLLEGTSWII